MHLQIITFLSMSFFLLQPQDGLHSAGLRPVKLYAHNRGSPLPAPVTLTTRAGQTTAPLRSTA